MGKRTESSGKSDAGGVPTVRAVLVADLHLQATAPVARSAEPDWFAAMQRPLAEVSALATLHKCPVLYAGDIFDRWNASAEVINFALRALPKGFAVPGQHDLPNHNYAEMGRSAYGTLVAAGHIETLPPGVPVCVQQGLWVTGFPWGMPPTPTTPAADSDLQIAIIHRYVWVKGCGYPGAPEDHKLSTTSLQGYHVAAFGDNHLGFLAAPAKRGDPWVLNCGGFMRRKTDERDYRPGCGLLMGDGSVVRYYFDTVADKFIALTAAEEAVGQTLNMGAFVEELKSLGNGDALNFTTTMKRFMESNKTAPGVQRVILEAMGDA